MDQNELLENEKKFQKYLQEEATLHKWNEIVSNLQDYMVNRKEDLKKSLREGVPDFMRGYVWQTLGQVNKVKVESEYKRLSKIKDCLYHGEVPTLLVDLPRTKQNVVFYQEKYGCGQLKLYEVMKNFILYHKEVCYIQGFSSIVACFLLHMDEETAFWLFISIIDNYGHKNIVKDNFKDLKIYEFIIFL